MRQPADEVNRFVRTFQRSKPPVPDVGDAGCLLVPAEVVATAPPSAGLCARTGGRPRNGHGSLPGTTTTSTADNPARAAQAAARESEPNGGRGGVVEALRVLRTAEPQLRCAPAPGAVTRSSPGVGSRMSSTSALPGEVVVSMCLPTVFANAPATKCEQSRAALRACRGRRSGGPPYWRSGRPGHRDAQQTVG